MGEDGPDLSPAPGRRQVLLADRERASRVALTRLLERAGHSVTVCADGAEVAAALAALPPAHPAAVVMDSREPAAGVAAVLAALTVREGPRARLVMLGSRADRMESAKFLALGADAYLVKPFLMVELEALIAPPVEERRPAANDDGAGAVNRPAAGGPGAGGTGGDAGQRGDAP